MRRSVTGLGAVVLLVVAASCSPLPSGQAGTSSPRPSPSPSLAPVSPTPVPSPSPAPAQSPTPPPATPAPPPAVAACPAGFAAAGASGGSAAGGRAATARVGSHPGYDRFVVELSGAVPGYTVSLQAAPSFVQSPKGDTVTLEGSEGVLIAIQPALDWTSYAGPTELRPRFAVLREARQVENFEGVQQWALGVSGPVCLRVFTLGSPPRLVVDVASGR